MAAYHSIWLMPCAEDGALFDGIVGRLAAGFGTEPFIPHLTLVEDMPRTAEDLAGVVDAAFAGAAVFSATIARVDGGPSFFRSLYAAFLPEGPLLELKRVAVERFGVGEVASFMPHVSLAYGVPDEAKAAAIAELAPALVGRTVRFDEIVVAASAQSIPIRDWSIAHRRSLG